MKWIAPKQPNGIITNYQVGVLFTEELYNNTQFESWAFSFIVSVSKCQVSIVIDIFVCLTFFIVENCSMRERFKYLCTHLLNRTEEIFFKTLVTSQPILWLSKIICYYKTESIAVLQNAMLSLIFSYGRFHMISINFYFRFFRPSVCKNLCYKLITNLRPKSQHVFDYWLNIYFYYYCSIAVQKKIV